MTLTWCQNKLLCILEHLDLYIKTYTSKEHWESLKKKSQGDAGGLFKKSVIITALKDLISFSQPAE